MKRELLALIVCLVMSGFLMQACDKEQPLETSADPTGSEEEVSLDRDFGGYTTDDEAVMFNDAEVMAESGEDENVNDAVSYAAPTNLAAAADPKTYQVRITWGMLEGDSTATELIDWSGKVSVSRGVLSVFKVIRFESELQGDRLHLPRTSPRELAFTSHADKHYDGLSLLIVDQDGDTPGQFTIQAGNYARTFTFDELTRLQTVEPVGPNANAVSIISYRRGDRAVDGGFLAGRWVKTNDRGGKFFGRWINNEGANAGAVRGIWGVRRNGEQVFFGKYLGLNGEFAGLLAGHWTYDREEGSGVFEGKWFNLDRDEIGVLAGHFKPGHPGDGRGFFDGRWIKRK